MNTLWIVVIGAIAIYVFYNFYAKRIDKTVIQADAKRATPARMYMDGVDFMPTSKNVLYGYHFKSIAAAGPIVGPITAANLWGWLPALLWLVIGVSFIGWASDYSAIMVSVRNDGNSLSAISHKLIAPRTRQILFIFIFFYLLLVAGAFMGIMAALLASQIYVPFGIIMLAVMGFLGGQMLYKWKMDLILVTAIIVGVTVAAMLVRAVGQQRRRQGHRPHQRGDQGAERRHQHHLQRPTAAHRGDPTAADPRIPAPGADGKRPKTATYDPATGAIGTLPSYLFWALFLLVFAYLASTLPIWRFAQPVNYIGFWVTLLAIGLSALGAILAPFIKPAVGTFALAVGEDPGLCAADDPQHGLAADLADALRDHRLRRHLRLACAVRLGGHGAAVGV